MNRKLRPSSNYGEAKAISGGVTSPKCLGNKACPIAGATNPKPKSMGSSKIKGAASGPK